MRRRPRPLSRRREAAQTRRVVVGRRALRIGWTSHLFPSRGLFFCFFFFFLVTNNGLNCSVKWTVIFDCFFLRWLHFFLSIWFDLRWLYEVNSDFRLFSDHFFIFFARFSWYFYQFDLIFELINYFLIHSIWFFD